MTWNPDQYHKFQAQRSAPFDDLLKLVDLGCGTGELTRRLADSLPESLVLGLDSSPQMLAQAEAVKRPGLTFELGDQAGLSGEWDLIFSNAALQWSENHEQLIGHLHARLAKGGQIAVQVPSNHNHSSHRLIIETAQEESFRAILGGFVRYSPVLSLSDYAQLLFDLGAEDIIVFEKVYAHILENSDAVVEWVSGTALVPYFERLGEHKTAFLDVLRDKFRAAMPGQPVFYPFKRTLFSARKPR
ncbi:MAG: methyltransferase domain-containing protein [Chloroflexi bacterium]|nr:MAG: methyltransferase domain-containing protein [Chloroflexota bacterium]